MPGSSTMHEVAPARSRLDVVRLCQDLIRIDTSNPGSDERPAAEYVAAELAGLGLEPAVLEGEARRTNVVARIPGRDPSLPALLVHGHLDTVPAQADEWSQHPFAGEVVDGQIWGRGAVDMKDAVAMYLAAAAEVITERGGPERDIVLTFVADEEAGGRHGAAYLVHQHREIFEGCAVAVGEVGGFNVPSADGVSTFAISVADKGLRWYALERQGVAGHGSMIAEDNPILGLAHTLQQLASSPATPVVLEPMWRLAEAVAGRSLGSAAEVVAVLEGTGPFRPLFVAALQNTVNVTQVGAGYKDNVIPGSAWAHLDCRFLPGQEEQLVERVTGHLPPSVTASVLRASPPTEPTDSAWFEVLADAVRAVQPGSRVAPYVFSGGTDNKWFMELGIPTYGFTPLLLPASYDFPAMFHGVDERVPVSSLDFGVRVLTELFAS